MNFARRCLRSPENPAGLLRRAVLAAAAVTAVSTLALPGVSAAESDGETPAGSGAMTVRPGQHQLIYNWRSSVADMARSYANFGEAHWSARTRTLTIYGVGSPSKDLAKYMAAPPTDQVSATWVSCRYSQHQINIEINRLFAAHPRAIQEAESARHSNAIAVYTTSKALLDNPQPRQWLGTKFRVVVREARPIVPA